MSFLTEPEPRSVNQPNGIRASLSSRRRRTSALNRMSTTCSHSTRTAPSVVPVVSSTTNTVTVFHTRDWSAPLSNC